MAVTKQDLEILYEKISLVEKRLDEKIDALEKLLRDRRVIV